MNRFTQLFLDEAADLLDVLESGLLNLYHNNTATHDLHAIFRAAHSIKGNAGMTGFHAIARFTHVVENALDQLRSGRQQPQPTLLALLLRSTDCLKQMLQQPASAPIPPTAVEVQTLLAALLDTEARQHAISRDTNQTTTYRVRWTPPADCLTRAADPLRALAALAEIGQLKHLVCNTQSLPALTAIDPERCYLSWTFSIETTATRDEIIEIFSFQALDADLHLQSTNQEPPQSAEEPPSPETATLRIPCTKLDAIADLMGEIVIAQSMAIQIAHTTADNDHRTQSAKIPNHLALTNALDDLKRLTRDMQERVMRLRMVQVDQVFCRLPRLVHDLSQQLRKKIAIDLIGRETEIDRALVEKLSDPLIHLIRNCADHGIEDPTERIRNNKPDTGRIRLQAYCQGGHTIVEIEDDGRGLDNDGIRNKALQIGLIQPHMNLTESQLQSLIFHPGFSTADHVTSLSGRGVGLDAVRTSIEAVSGSVSVFSDKGKGTKFTLHLPMTMAILDGLLIKAASSVLVVPLASVTECLRPLPGQIRRIPDPHANYSEVLLSKDRVLPVLRLTPHLHLKPSETTAMTDTMAIIVEHNHQRSALLADEILGQQQVVIKNLDTNYRRIHGLQGAAILGDGRVALVLDIAGLLQNQQTSRIFIPMQSPQACPDVNA